MAKSTTSSNKLVETFNEYTSTSGAYINHPIIQDGKGSGLRFNQGKARYDLLPAHAIEKLVEVFTRGAAKYAPRNWEKGMVWSNIVQSLERHLAAFKRGEDFDAETGLLHVAHACWNALALVEYYNSFPQGDDRPHRYLEPSKIALDVDGVLADFGKAYKERLKQYGIPVREDDRQFHWEFSYQDGLVWEEVLRDKSFWLNLEPICDPHLPFEPVCYVSSRQIPVEWTQEWLENHGFPCEKVYHVGKDSKIQTLKDAGVEIFVDDNLDNFVSLNKAGICTFLFDKPYNRKLEVGYKRIKNLAELVK